MDARVVAPSAPEGAIQDDSYRPKPDGSLDPIGETGWFLQRERERRGEALEQASEATGIHASHLHAIEMGDLRGMPHRAEALQMIGLYALHMGFEPEPLMAHYNQFLPKTVRIAHPADPAPLSSAKVIKFGKGLLGGKLGRFSFGRGTIGIIGSCLAAGLLFAGASWMMEPTPDMAALESVLQESDPMPTASVEPTIEVTEEDMPDDGGHASASVLPGGQAAVGVEPGADPNGERSLDGLTALIEKTVGGEAEAKATKPAPEKKTAATEPPVPSGDAGKSRLVLKAKAPVWIRVQDTHGNAVVTKMLMPGDNYRVPEREGLIVIARDGGLLLYEIDGKDYGILGTPGEILVGQPLDIKTLEKRG